VIPLGQVQPPLLNEQSTSSGTVCIVIVVAEVDDAVPEEIVTTSNSNEFSLNSMVSQLELSAKHQTNGTPSFMEIVIRHSGGHRMRSVVGVRPSILSRTRISFDQVD
jgi:hypothetical protein